MRGVRPYLILVLSLLVALAACTPEEALPTQAVLPTLAQLPTDAAQPITRTSTPAPPDPEEAQIAIERTVPGTLTQTPTPSETATVTVTASQTITDTPSPTATDLPTIGPDDRPLMGLMDYAAQVTLLPTDFFPADLTPLGPPPTQIPVTVSGVEIISTSIGGGNVPVTVVTPITPVVSVPTSSAGTCPFLPPGGFATAYANNPDLANQLGCALGNPPTATVIPGAYQTFQQGRMVWLSGDIYVLYSTGGYEYYADTYVDGSDPETSSETPPDGLFAPLRGFLKVWSNNATVRSGLGWGLTDEIGSQATVADFANGRMISFEGRTEIIVLIGPVNSIGSWRTVAGQY
ncbi:MAG: hypothetical protein CL607_06410 [Anaerolineaceae bacterium]|nr:hypothetical protein [Anaerolineaceae bacterium]